MRKGVVYTILFMLVITVVFTGILAVANDVTKAQVENNQILKIRRSHLLAFNIPFSAQAGQQEIMDLYGRSIKSEKKDELEVFTAQNEKGETLGYGVPFQGPGLWGTIEGFLALSADGKKILGIDFTEQSETPGLGARIDESFFKEQFRGIALFEGEKAIRFKPNEEDGQVDAITGASITSGAVEKMMNIAIEDFREKMGGAK